MTDTKNELRIEYVRLDEAVKLFWKKNPKLHDLQALAESFLRYGFRDAPAFDATLQEGGAIVDGNGRIETLGWMFDQKQQNQEPGQDKPRFAQVPVGIRVSEDEMWWVPIQFGVDSESQAIAEAYAIDANNTTMLGGDFAAWDIARMWDEDAYTALLQGLANDDALPVSVDGDDLDALLAGFAFDEDADKAGGSDKESPYSRKIEAPIYEVTGAKPPVTSLVDLSKFEELAQKIKDADVSPSVRRFLRFAAHRHCVFDYQQIAEFYAHADKELQELMEDSALVIIDFDAAIEKGFVRLSHEIAETYRSEYGSSG